MKNSLANSTAEIDSPALRRVAVMLAIATLVAASLAQSACNTTKGVGRDVEAVGRGVERAGGGR